MINKLFLGAALTVTLALAPAMAQSQIDNNQPVQGSLQTREAVLQNKLNVCYDAGNIDSTELASLQRDFDGILVKEERLKSKAGGLTDSGYSSISSALDLFESKLSGHAIKNGMAVGAGSAITGNQSSLIIPTGKTVIAPVVVETPVLVPASETVVAPGPEVLMPASTETVIEKRTVTPDSGRIVIPVDGSVVRP